MLVVWGAVAQAQQPKKVPRIGLLSPLSSSTASLNLEAFRKSLREIGYVEGQNIAIDYRFAEGRFDRLPQLAAELVQLKVDIIVAGSVSGALATKKASGSIPIVFVGIGDPVANGLVASLARPGGNVTGMTLQSVDTAPKQLELLKEAFPKVVRVAVLSNPANPDSGPSIKGMEVAARSLGVQLRVVEVRDPTEFEKAFAAIRSERAGALMVLNDITFNTHRGRIVELAAKGRLPTMYGFREFVDAGGLMSYGAGLPDIYRRAAIFVDKILKGRKPADLPVEQPMKFEFVINLRAAQQIGLTIPQSVLFRADKVIK